VCYVQEKGLTHAATKRTLLPQHERPVAAWHARARNDSDHAAL